MDPQTPDAFTDLFEANHAAVLAYALRRCVSVADAEDAAAETFVVAWRRRADVPDDIRPWLYGVARRVIANQRRGLARWARLRERLSGAASTKAVTEGGRATVALARLSTDDQELLRLVAWEELSHAQIGVVLGISANAVSIRLHRARRRFADELARLRSGEVKGSGPSRTSTSVKGAHDWHEETR